MHLAFFGAPTYQNLIKYLAWLSDPASGGRRKLTTFSRMFLIQRDEAA
jgi:hypothetical protein